MRYIVFSSLLNLHSESLKFTVDNFRIKKKKLPGIIETTRYYYYYYHYYYTVSNSMNVIALMVVLHVCTLVSGIRRTFCHLFAIEVPVGKKKH